MKVLHRPGPCRGVRAAAVLGCPVLAAFALPSPARADVGVPMIALMAVPMWTLLLAIIPLEAWIARKVIKLGWARALRLSTVANLVSTVLGVPLTWLVLAGLEIAVTNAGPRLDRLEPLFTHNPWLGGALGLMMTAPWLYPIAHSLYWMMPAAALLLLVPFFFASVWIEYLVARRFVPRGERAGAMRWSWSANAASYALRGGVAAAMLAVALVQHQRIASDEAHRPVDRVPIERLWQLAVERAQSGAAARQDVPTTVVDGRPPAGDDVDSLWRAGDDASRDGDDAAAERNWVAALTKIDRPGLRVDDPLRPGTISTAEVLLSLSRLYLRQSRAADARPLLERLVRIRDARLAAGRPHSDFPSYPVELAGVYEQLGDTTRAVAFLQHVLDRDAGAHGLEQEIVLQALVGLARAQEREGDAAGAESLYADAIRHGGDLLVTGEAQEARIEAFRRLAALERGQRRFAAAESLLDGGIAAAQHYAGRPEFPDSGAAAPYFLERALVHLDQGRLEEATHDIKCVIRWGDQLRDAALAYATVLERQGRASEAAAWRMRADSLSSRRE